MKAAVLTLNGFELQEIEKPTIKADEILIKTVACGVCSGDVFVYANRADFIQTYNRLGHEASGEVVALGRDVTDIHIGDIVTTLALPAYADYYVAKANMVVKLPEGVDPHYALGEAVACCVHAANRFGIKAGDKVAIIGCGFMGLLCLQLAKHQGAGTICAIDPMADRLAMAQQLKAQVVYDPTKQSGAEILAEQGEFDVVIEAAGNQSALDLCTQLVTLHGRIILIGYHQSNNGQRTVNMERWNYKAIDVINGHVRRDDEKVEAMRQGMALMSAGHIITTPLVTFFDFAEIEQSFQQLTAGTPGLFKAVLRMQPTTD